MANKMARTRDSLARHTNNFDNRRFAATKEILMHMKEIIDLKLNLFYCKARMWMWKYVKMVLEGWELGDVQYFLPC